MRTRGFARLERSLIDELPGMSGAACKVYVALLILCDYRTGRCTTDAGTLARATGLSRRSTERALAELDGRLLRWHRGVNGHVSATMELFSHTAWITACGQPVDNVAVSVDEPVDTHVDSVWTTGGSATHMTRYTTSDLQKRA